jgi:peptidoglycan hydrolase CwlO-like protein
MKQPLYSREILLCLIFILPSCGDDPKLVAVREQQRAEISQLSGELALIEEKIRHLPQDLSGDLEATLKKAEQQKAEIAQLESEIAQLEARKLSLQEEFQSYRVKYRTK